MTVREILTPPPSDPYDVSHRIRYFVFTRVDVQAYSDLLLAAFPELRIHDWPKNSETSATQSAPPELRFRSSLAEIEGGYGTLIFDPNWVPTWHRNQAPSRAPEEEKLSYRWWVLDSSYLPNGTFEWTGRIFQDRGEPEHIAQGRIYIRCAKNDREHESVAGRVIRLIAKIAVNKFRGVEYPSMNEMYRKEKGGEIWIGHDAARWCREAPDRILDYNSHGKFGCLPLD